MAREFDAGLMIAFGGPTRMEDVRPFLANVLRGRPVPPERIEEVVHHYELIGGRSPLNEITYRQATALEDVLRADGRRLPVYVGMRNWAPLLVDALRRMGNEGVRRAVGVILAAHQSDASWDKYQRSVIEARQQLGHGAPEVDYVAPWFDHPLFIEAVADQVQRAIESIPVERRGSVPWIFTAHSIPVAMAEASPYVEQLRASCRLVAERLGHARWQLAFQSRSGSPQEPWLEPDVGDVIRRLAAEREKAVLVVPIGFVADHVEVLYDLDIETRQIADERGMEFLRAKTVNDHPAFIRMLADVVRKRVSDG